MTQLLRKTFSISAFSLLLFEVLFSLMVYGHGKVSLLLVASIRENGMMQVEQLRVLEPVLAKRVREGSVKSIDALDDLHSREIKFFQ